ncbi:MAG: branched-chain amino acid aminotransferase, partial [Phycisphaeraceae bacterium]
MPTQDRPLIWIDGQLVPKSEAKVSVFDHGFLYGDGVFEGIRVYRGKVFKCMSHLKRIYR